MNSRRAPTRALRGALLAVVSGALSVAAHGVGGGSLSEFGPAVPLVVLIAGAAASLADHRTGKLSILAALGTAQLAQHSLLSWVGHDHVPPTSSVQMTAAHAVAVLLTGLLLARAETALFALVAAVSQLLPKRLTPLPAVAPLRVRTAPVPATVVLHEVLLRRVHGRRGPPLCS